MFSDCQRCDFNEVNCPKLCVTFRFFHCSNLDVHMIFIKI